MSVSHVRRFPAMEVPLLRIAHGRRPCLEVPFVDAAAVLIAGTHRGGDVRTIRVA
jgi:hypothetical protein